MYSVYEPVKFGILSVARFFTFFRSLFMVGPGIMQVARGSMRPDVFLALFMFCLNIYSVISGLVGLLYRFDAGLNGLDRQRTFLELTPNPTKRRMRKSSIRPLMKMSFLG